MKLISVLVTILLCGIATAQEVQRDLDKKDVLKILSASDVEHVCKGGKYFFGRRLKDKSSPDELLEIQCGVIEFKGGVCYLPAKVMTIKCENGVDPLVCAKKADGDHLPRFSRLNYGLIAKSAAVCAESIGMHGFASSSDNLSGVMKHFAIIRGAINKINPGSSPIEKGFFFCVRREALRSHAIIGAG